MLGPLQSQPISNLPGDCLSPVHPDHLLTLDGGGEAPLAPVPTTTMVLEDSVGRGVITVNGNVEDVSLTPMATQCVVNENAPLLCFPLEPFGADETASVVRIEGSLVTIHMRRMCESGLTIPTSVAVRHLFDVSDQEGVPLVNTHCQNRPANFVIVGGKLGLDEVTVWLNRVSGNALFEVLFKQRQMLVGHTVTKAGALGKESFSKFAGSANVAFCISTPMNCNATEETKIVSINVERKNSVLVAKPIRKTTEP